MLLQTVPNAIVQKIDSLRILTESVMNAQQAHSVEMESIRDSVHTQLAAVTAQLDTIPAFGVKYGDTMAYIAIPLIIALFAFAFMYMLSVITRVNQKYDSESINHMFKTSGTYCCYLVSSILGIAYVLGFGLTTCFTDISQEAMKWLSVAGVVIAGFFAGCVLCFVLACLRYDNHFRLLWVMGNRYWRHRRSQRSFNNYMNRLRDLCKYAIRIKDNSLFWTTLDQVNEQDEAIKKKTGEKVVQSTLSIYDSIVECFIQTPTWGEMERSLFEYWQETFSHKELSNPIAYSFMLRRVVEAVKRGQRHMFEAYAEMCRTGFDFIYRAAEVQYIVGKDVEEQKRIDDERLKIWSDLRETHYLATSYLFSLGHYEVLNVFKKKAGYDRDSFFPMTIPGVLQLYADCKAKQDPKTRQYRFDYWPNNNVIRGGYDSDILEELTAMLVLMMSQQDIVGNEIIVGEKKKSLLFNSRNQIIKYGNLWRNNGELGNRFPQITTVRFEKKLDEELSRLKTGVIEEPKSNGQKAKKFYYDLPILPADELPIRALYNSFFKTDKSFTFNLLKGASDKKNNKNETIAFGSYTLLVDKPSLKTPAIWKDPAVEHNMTEIFRKRYLHTVYEALSQMRFKDITTTWERFEHHFLKYVGDEGARYVMINTDCYVMEDLHFDNPMDAKSKSSTAYYRGAPFFDTTAYLSDDYRRDLPLLQSYEYTILVIKKEDLPALVSTSENNMPTISFNDESDRDKGRAKVRITVDPCRSLCFSKDAEVGRFRIKV